MTTRKAAHVIAVSTVSAMLAVSVAGCGSSGGKAGTSAAPAAGTPGKPGGTLHILSVDSFEHLDPARNYVTSTENVSRLIYRTLTTYAAAPGAEGGKIVPDLATDTGRPSDGAKTWTFTLRDGVEFEDGTPITSADIKYGVERSFADVLPEGAPYGRMWLVGGDKYQGPYKDQNGLASIETPDPKTIVFHLTRPVADFGSATSMPIFAPVPKAQDKGVDYDKRPFSSGPYEIVSYDPKKDLTLTRNPHWSAATDPVRKALPDKIVFDLGLDPTVVDQRMIAAQGPDKDAVSMEPVAAASVSKVLTDPTLKPRLVQGTSTNTRYLSLNTAHKPMDNVKVRQAVEYALDKEALRTDYGGPIGGDLATGLIPPTVPGYIPGDPYATPGGKGDPAKAKQLLTEAGFPDGIDVTLDSSSSAGGKKIGEAVQESLGKAGIRVKINEVPSSAFWSTVGTTSSEHDMVVAGWSPDWTTPSTYLPLVLDGRGITAQGNNNLAQYNSAAVNQKFDEIAAMTDVDAQNKAYGDLAQQIMATDAPMVPFLWEKAATLIGPNVAGAYGHIAYVGRLDLVSLGLKQP